MGYNKRFQKHRKLFHSVFSKAQSHTFAGTQTKAAQVLVKELIESQNPESHNLLVRRLGLLPNQRKLLLKCVCHLKVFHNSRHEDRIWSPD
jgi:hypothetical protein